MESLRELLNSLDLEEEDILENVIKDGETPDIVFAGLLDILDNYEGDDDLHFFDDYAQESIDKVFSLVADISRKDPDEVKDFLYRAVIHLAIVNLLERDSDTVKRLIQVFRKALDIKEAVEDEESGWIWSVKNLGPSGGESSGGHGPLGLREFSILKMFGYTVGKGKNSWPKDKRHKLLTHIMERKLPEIVKETFGDWYGEPMTAHRLERMANLISSICRLNIQKNDSSYEQAISDWKTDLDFLKKKYYGVGGLNSFLWPDPDNQW